MIKKNSFLVFVFSLMPGAGHMYLGLMKPGLQLLALFWGSIAAAAMGSSILSFFLFYASDIFTWSLLIILPLCFCYSVFDAMNKNNALATGAVLFQDIAGEDVLFIRWIKSALGGKWPKAKGSPKRIGRVPRWVGWTLIVLGLLFLVNNLSDTIFSNLRLYFPNRSDYFYDYYWSVYRVVRGIIAQAIVSGLLIAGGVWFLKKPRAPKSPDELPPQLEGDNSGRTDGEV